MKTLFTPHHRYSSRKAKHLTHISDERWKEFQTLKIVWDSVDSDRQLFDSIWKEAQAILKDKSTPCEDTMKRVLAKARFSATGPFNFVNFPSTVERRKEHIDGLFEQIFETTSETEARGIYNELNKELVRAPHFLALECQAYRAELMEDHLDVDECLDGPKEELRRVDRERTWKGTVDETGSGFVAVAQLESS